MDEFCGNRFWDSNLTWYTEDPDLTPCFQNTVLVWLPCAFLWLWAPYQIYASAHSLTKNIPWNALNILKLAFTALLMVVQVLELVWLAIHSAGEDSMWYAADFLTPAVKLVTFAMVMFLDAYNRVHGMRSSGTVFLFWFVLAVCEAVGFRAAMRQSEEHPKYNITYFYVLEVIYYPVILGQLLLNFWADAPPRDHGPIPVGDRPCPEHASSFPSRLLFFWFEKLARMGYKTPLEVDHLWNLNPEDTSRYMNPIFHGYWTAALEKVRGGRKDGADAPKQEKIVYTKNSIEFKPVKPPKKKWASVLPPLAKMFGGTFLFASLISLLRDLLTFTTPQILNLLIGHVSEGNTDETWKGYIYAVLLFLANAASTLMGNQYNYMLFMMGMKIRTTVVSAIYRKAVRISNAAREESTVGEIVNLMSVDTQRLTELCGYLNVFWSAPLQIGLSLYFLWQVLGPSVLAGVGVMILLLPINAVIATKARKYQMKQMKLKDRRIKLMNEILSGIKVLKLYAWEPSFEDQIMGIRGQEIQVLRKSALLNAGTIFVWTCAPFFVSAVTFATYVLVDEHNVLDAQKAFVSLTLFNIMRMPLNLLPMLIVFMVQASVSIKRINKYMNAEEIQDDAVNHDPNSDDQVAVKNGNFAWKEDTPILRDINFNVKEGQLVAVVGTVGAGKSTLLSALLGEVDHQSGQVQTKGRIAYVAQQPWIQNATVRENILFGLPFDGNKYDKVLDGCALRPDLEILQAGDHTEIGEKGINLSGGQKQRVALARATYNHADLYLFDDPLSAVDSHVAKHLFEKVIGPTGMLKRKTRVLVTHGVTFLPQMDNIIVLSDGEISEQGTYKELLAKKGAFADFLIQHIASEDGEVAAELEEDEDCACIMSDLKAALGSKEELMKRRSRSRISESSTEESPSKYRRQFSKQISIISKASALSEESGSGDFVSAPTSPRRRLNSSKGSHVSLTGSKVMNGDVGGKKDEARDKLIEVEASETGTVKLSVFLFYMRAVGLVMACTVLFLQLFTQVLAVSSNLWLTSWANDNAGLNGTQDVGKRDMYLSVYVSLGVGQGLGTLISATVMAYGSLRASGFLHYQMFHRILRAPMSFFDTTPTGRIVNRFGKDVDIADNAIPMSMSFWLNCLFWVLSTLIIICYVTPIFTVVVIPVAIFYFFAQRYYVATLRQLRRLESVTRSPIYSHFGETLTGTTTIRAFGMQDRFIAQSEAKVDHNQVTYFPTIVANRFLAVALEMIGNLVILCAAILAVMSRGSLSAGLVGLSVTYSLQITQSLNWLVKMSTDVETNLVSVERLKEYGEVVQEADYENNSTKPASKWPEAGQVVFDKYRTRYREGLDLVLQDVTCKIEPGEKVGIVGRTGAGKSSLTLSLFRLIEAAGGSISIDGVDIGKLGLHDVRRRLTIIPQDPIIFSGTLRLNLDPFNEHSDEEIWRSLELSHLKPFVKGLGSGLAYELTEGGENLSVGQRQLVCLARALLRKSKILVLDEATAAIDLETDDLIQQTIRKEFAECTILTIAHRLNTIMDYGRVMVLDRGMISEFDSPAALLENKNSIFYGMAKDAGLA